MQDMRESLDDLSLIDDIIDIVNVIRKRSKLILLVVAASVIITGYTSNQGHNMYKSRAVILPVISHQVRNSTSMVDSQIGISMPALSDVTELVSLLNSDILIERVVKNEAIFPIFLHESIEKDTDPAKISKGIRRLKSTYSVNYNSKKGTIELSVRFTNPKTTTDILNQILHELTNYMSSEAKRVAETNRKYLESLINRNSDPLIRQKIYSLVARQIEISMMAEVKENFAFKVIDPPRVPYTKIASSMKKNIMISLIRSIIAGILLCVFVESILKRK